MDYKWRFQRLFVRLYKNSKPLIKDFATDLKEVVEIGYYFPRDVCRFLIKLAQYGKLLWNDVDYDYSAILRLLQYKISRTRKHIKEHGHLKNTDKYCAQMEEAEKLIDAILEDDFANKEMEEHDKKWGKSKLATVDVPGENCAEIRFLRLKVRNKSDEAKERKEYVKILDLDIKRKEEAWSRLWFIVKKNLRRWWD